MTGLRAHVVASRGDFRLDVELTVEPGEVVALLGPNGAGKSTVLAAVAGLLALDAGCVELGGRVLDDPGAGVRLPPSERRIGVVFSDALLFAHLSVLENVAFGPRALGVAKDVARRRARELLDSLDVGELAVRRPRQLSGGQAQKVALARALAVEPELLLLDEPLSALDAGARPRVRADLRRRLRDPAVQPGRPCLVVTHDLVDALVLADRVVVVEAGRVEQAGSLAELTARPRTDYVARLVGVNLYRGRAAGSLVELEGGGSLALAEAAHGDVLVVVPPNAVALHRSAPAPGSSPRNAWPVVVSELTGVGERVRVVLVGAPPAVVEVTPAAVAELALVEGERCWAVVKATDVTAFSA